MTMRRIRGGIDDRAGLVEVMNILFVSMVLLPVCLFSACSTCSYSSQFSVPLLWSQYISSLVCCYVVAVVCLSVPISSY